MEQHSLVEKGGGMDRVGGPLGPVLHTPLSVAANSLQTS